MNKRYVYHDRVSLGCGEELGRFKNLIEWLSDTPPKRVMSTG